MTRVPLPLVRLNAGGRGVNATANVQLKLGDRPMRLEITVPTEPVTRRELLPIAHGLTDVIVSSAADDVERQGERISCQKGCGACCRQVVPISESEAHALAVLVAAMPEPRRSTIRARFADALHRFAEVGLIEGLRDPVNIPDAELRSFGMAYFDTGVPCPFLEDESCSIYENRPAACREYLVMSPAEECKHPKPTTIRQILLPITISRLIRDLEDRQWVPMIVALEWSASHAEAAARPGTVLVEEFFRKLIEASQLPPS